MTNGKHRQRFPGGLPDGGPAVPVALSRQLSTLLPHPAASSREVATQAAKTLISEGDTLRGGK